MKSPPIHWATRWASINAVNAGCLGGGGGGGDMKSPPIHWATRWASINAVNTGCLGGKCEIGNMGGGVNVSPLLLSSITFHVFHSAVGIN